MSEWTEYDLPGGGLAHVRKVHIACVHVLGGDPVNQARVTLDYGETFVVEHPIVEAMRGLDA